MDNRSRGQDTTSIFNRSPQLSPSIQRHLGLLLRAAYDDMPSSVPDRFQILIDNLSSAIETQETITDTQFKKSLLQVVPSLQKFAISLTRNMAAADDLVQDTLLRGWRARNSYQIDTNISAWLFTIMRNRFYSVVRNTKREVADVDGYFSEKVAVIPEQMGRLDLIDLQRALAALPAAMRQALVLVTIEDLSYQDAAVVMNCQVGTVKSRVSRGRERLASELGFGPDDIGIDSHILSAIGEPIST